VRLDREPPFVTAMIRIPHKRSSDVILLKVDADTLEDMDLQEAYLAGARMAGLRCARADLRGASLQGADLRDVDLSDAKLSSCDLRSADLRGTDLTGADLTASRVTGATYSAATRWPDGFDPSLHGALAAAPETMSPPEEGQKGGSASSASLRAALGHGALAASQPQFRHQPPIDLREAHDSHGRCWRTRVRVQRLVAWSQRLRDALYSRR
jgi:hypothetical protein